MFRPLGLKSVQSICVAAGLVVASQAAFAESRLALVIGQSAYRAVTPLPNPANDAKAMTQMLGDAGFEVQAASDLTQTDLRQTVSDFAARIAAKGPDTVALIFYAGHGMQIDGENYLIPVDLDPKREADVPLQAVRLDDVMNTLGSVPSRMRIVLLDACRNNPFPAVNRSAGHGLALVNARLGDPGTFLSFSTSPGAEAEDGSGANSPYTTALLTAGRQPGAPIEDAFKRVRLAVNKATEGRQTPWDSSSLTDDFRFFPGAGDAGAKPPAVKRSVEDWRSELRGQPAEAANDLVVADGTDEAYEAFVALYAESPFGLQAREWLDRHRRMVAWNVAVVRNTAAGYRDFALNYPDSDLAATARRLEQRLHNRPVDANAAISAAIAPTPVALAAPTCPCSQPAPSSPKLQKKVELPPPARRAEREPPKRVVNRPPPRGPRRPPPDDDEDAVVYQRAPVYEPAPYIGRVIGGTLGGGYNRPSGNYGGSRR